MKRTHLTAAVAGLALVLSSNAIAKGQPEPGDDKKGHPVMVARETQPGDDRGGRREPQPGDDRRGRREPQPGDDRRGKGNPVQMAKGQPEPGDDRGGKGHPVA